MLDFDSTGKNSNTNKLVILILDGHLLHNNKKL